MQSYFAGVIVIFTATVLSVAGMLAVRRFVGLEKLRSYHEVAGYLLQVIGTLYAVVLGFVVVDAMTHLQDARTTVEQEANSVANIFLLADGFKSELRRDIQSHCRGYVEAVVGEEWPEMRHHKFSEKAVFHAWKLWHGITHIKPVDDGEVSLHQTMVEQIGQLSDARRLRLVMSMHGVSPVMWVALIAGGVFTVAFTYFFGMESLRTQMLMTVLIVVSLSLNVFLVELFGNPFSGDVAVHPDAFVFDLRIFDRYQKVCEPGFVSTPENRPID